MIPVLSDIPAYSPRLMPETCVAVDTPDRAVVVVDGDGDWDLRAAARLEQGAHALVIAEPQPIPANRLDLLIERAGGRPVVLDRPEVRREVLVEVVDAIGAVASVQVRALGPAGQRRRLVETVLTWVLAVGGEPTRVRMASAPGFSRALLRSDRGWFAGVQITDSNAPPAWELTVLGETRIRIGFDSLRGPAHALRVETTEQDRSTIRSALWESSARSSLRRGLGAVVTGEPVDDLRLLAASARHADALGA